LGLFRQAHQLREKDREKGIIEKHDKISFCVQNSIGRDPPEGHPRVHAIYKEANITDAADKYEFE
jgi:hypothetical protein